MNIQHKNERYFEEDIWVMDSECCCKCGALLDEDETDLCAACRHGAWYSQEQERYAGWDDNTMWHCQECKLDVTLPAFFAAVSLFAWAAVLESRGEG